MSRYFFGAKEFSKIKIEARWEKVQLYNLVSQVFNNIFNLNARPSYYVFSENPV